MSNLGLQTGRSTLGIKMGRSALGVRMAGASRLIAYPADDKSTVVVVLEKDGSLFKTISIDRVRTLVESINPTHAASLFLAGTMVWDQYFNLYVSYQVAEDWYGSADAYLAKYSLSGQLVWCQYAGTKWQDYKLQSAPIILPNGDALYAQRIFSTKDGTVLDDSGAGRTDPTVVGDDMLYSHGGGLSLVQRDISIYPPIYIGQGLFDIETNGLSNNTYKAGPVPLHSNGWFALPYVNNGSGSMNTWSAVAGMTILNSDLIQEFENNANWTSGVGNQKFYLLNARAWPFEHGWITGFRYVTSSEMVFFDLQSNSRKESAGLSIPIIRSLGDFVIDDHTMYYTTYINDQYVLGKTILTMTGDYSISSSLVWQKDLPQDLPIMMRSGESARLAVSPASQ